VVVSWKQCRIEKLLQQATYNKLYSAYIVAAAAMTGCILRLFLIASLFKCDFLIFLHH